MQIMCNTLSAYHMQHVVRKVEQRDSSDFKFDRVDIAFISALFHWLKLLTDEEQCMSAWPSAQQTGWLAVQT